MPKGKPISQIVSSDLQNALQNELKEVEDHLSQLVEHEAQIMADLRAIKIEKSLYGERREHAKALLMHSKPNSGSELKTYSGDNIDKNPNLDFVGKRPNTAETLLSEVYEVLKETEPSQGLPGAPMHYRDLVTALEKRGTYVGGRDPGLTLVAYIHKAQEFVRPKRGMYGLKEWYPSPVSNVGERSRKTP